MGLTLYEFKYSYKSCTLHISHDSSQVFSRSPARTLNYLWLQWIYTIYILLSNCYILLVWLRSSRLNSLAHCRRAHFIFVTIDLLFWGFCKSFPLPFALVSYWPRPRARAMRQLFSFLSAFLHKMHLSQKLLSKSCFRQERFQTNYKEYRRTLWFLNNWFYLGIAAFV